MRVYKGDKYFNLYNTREVIKQQQDVFELAKSRNKKENDGITKPIKRSMKEVREEQHNNRLFHEQNEKKLMKLYGDT
jgi:hypothetical protein